MIADATIGPAPSTAPSMPSIPEPKIVSTPGICGGQPRIDGTRIKVRHVVHCVERQGMSIADVLEHHPHLNRAQIHAALAYYWCHQAEIDQSIRDEEAFVAEMKAKAPPSILTGRTLPKSS